MKTTPLPGLRSIAATAALAGVLAAAAPAIGQMPAGVATDPSGKVMMKQALPKSDAEFFEKAAISGMTEVQAGQLAQQKSSDPTIKQFGATLVSDHSKAASELQALATAKGVTLPTSVDAEHQKMLDKLQQASGKDFDDEFSDDMHAGHEKAVALFQQTARSSKDPDVKAFAVKTLPVLQSHEAIAKKLDDRH